MTTPGWTALAIAVFGAFSYGAGSILQAVGARRSSGTVRTLGHPLYLLGVGCDLLAWAGSMIALRELAVYQVQSVLAGSLAVTAVAARLFLAARLRRWDVAAVAVTIPALTVLAMSAGPQEQVTASGPLRYGLCAAALATALIGWGATRVTTPGVVAAIAGLALGGGALCSRALTVPPRPTADPVATALALGTEPLTAALLLFSATGMLLYTNALRYGQVGPVTAVLWIGEVIAPSAVALLLLGDTVRPGWEPAAAVAGLVTVGAAVLLATAPANGPGADAPAPAMLPAGHRPAALPAAGPVPVPVVWWGAPPIWRPPKRPLALPAAAPRPRPVPMAAPVRALPPPAGERRPGTNPWWEPPTDPRPAWRPPGTASR